MRRLFDSARFWLTLGGIVSTIGGVFVTVGATRTPAHASVWTSGWFDAGIAVMGMGVLMLWGSLTLVVAHRHAERHIAALTSGHQMGGRLSRADRRLTLVDHRRFGFGLLASHEFSVPAAQEWTNSVFGFLRQALPHADAERFINAGSVVDTDLVRVPARLAVLEDLIERERTGPLRRRLTAWLGQCKAVLRAWRGW